MESDNSVESLTFFERLGMAFRLLFNREFAANVRAGLQWVESKGATPKLKHTVVQEAPERVHAPGLFVLSALQREGRLIDFLQQDVAGFSDEEIGAAARVVHAGCKKALEQYFDLEPASGVAEGTTMSIPSGFDAQRIRLTGNVTGQPPFKGVLKHHGWIAKEIRLPLLTEALDPRVVAPAEVEVA
ncbi:MAG: DUF2760 domain-containing protein [Verrucomicrobiia bacterium]